jgi:hypothetical protein
MAVSWICFVEGHDGIGDWKVRELSNSIEPQEEGGTQQGDDDGEGQTLWLSCSVRASYGELRLDPEWTPAFV